VTHLLYNWTIGFFIWLARVLPLRTSYRIAEALTWFHYHFFPGRRRGAMSNVLIALGDGELKREARKTTYRIFRNFMRYLVEMFRFPTISKENLARFIRLEGLENLDSALELGRGAVLVTVHLGNWELAGAALSLSGYPLNVIVGDQMTTRVKGFSRYRWEKGMKAITPADSFKEIFRALKKNEVVVIMLDGYLFDHYVQVPFFGRPLRLPTGAAKLARKTGAPIVPGVCVRDDSRRLRARVLPPLEVDTAIPEEEALSSTTRRLASIMEAEIGRHLDQWCIFRPLWE